MFPYNFENGKKYAMQQLRDNVHNVRKLKQFVDTGKVLDGSNLSPYDQGILAGIADYGKRLNYNVSTTPATFGSTQL